MESNWKDRLQAVYSTNPDFKVDSEEQADIPTLDPEKQNLVVSIERKNRGGKTVTIVKGYTGSNDNLNDLAKYLKTKCGVGGAVKEGEIIIQGELKIKIAELLKTKGYRVKVSG